MSGGRIEEPSDDEWRSEMVKDFQRVGKSPVGTPKETEKPSVWLFIGLAAPWILTFPIVFLEILALAYFDLRIVHDINLYSPTSTQLAAFTIGLLVVCAAPCCLGLGLYKNKAYLVSFLGGYAASLICTAFFLAKLLMPAMYHPKF